MFMQVIQRTPRPLLLCELDGNQLELEAQHQKLTGILDINGASKITTAWEETERLRLWLGRKSAFPAVGRISPDYYCMDGTIPRRELPHVLTAISELSRTFSLPVANVSMLAMVICTR